MKHIGRQFLVYSVLLIAFIVIGAIFLFWEPSSDPSNTKETLTSQKSDSIDSRHGERQLTGAPIAKPNISEAPDVVSDRLDVKAPLPERKRITRQPIQSIPEMLIEGTVKERYISTADVAIDPNIAEEIDVELAKLHAGLLPPEPSFEFMREEMERVVEAEKKITLSKETLEIESKITTDPKEAENR